MTDLPLDPPTYPYYPWEYASVRLRAQRAQDAAVAMLLVRLRRWWRG